MTTTKTTEETVYAVQVMWPDKDDDVRWMFVVEGDSFDLQPQLWHSLSSAVAAARIWKPGSARVVARTRIMTETGWEAVA